jgi:hypothetical protein
MKNPFRLSNIPLAYRGVQHVIGTEPRRTRFPWITPVGITALGLYLFLAPRKSQVRATHAHALARTDARTCTRPASAMLGTGRVLQCWPGCVSVTLGGRGPRSRLTRHRAARTRG